MEKWEEQHGESREEHKKHKDKDEDKDERNYEDKDNLQQAFFSSAPS